MIYIIIGVLAVILAVCILIYGRRKNKELLIRLEDMLEKARNGSFGGGRIDETMLSSIENSMARFLEDSCLAGENLREQKERIQTLISDISHQTATPISNILIYSQLLEELCQGQEEREYAAVVGRQAEKLKFLLDSLVKVSRLENGIIQTNPVLGSVGSLVEEVRAMGESKAAKKEISIETKGEDFPVTAYFDYRWTVEALYNLVDNAIKYTDSGGKIQIEVIPYTIFCRINVTDDGRGICEEDQAEIFQRFYRSKDVLEQEGVGLGLYLTREILKGEGGYLKVSSKEGQGSTFSVFLLMPDNTARQENSTGKQREVKNDV